METTLKKRKIEYKRPPLRKGPCLQSLRAAAPTETKDGAVSFASPLPSSAVQANHASRVHHLVQQAKNFALTQAQQDGCMGSFKSFDSHFGNFLVPVIPSNEDLMK